MTSTVLRRDAKETSHHMAVTFTATLHCERHETFLSVLLLLLLLRALDDALHSTDLMLSHLLIRLMTSPVHSACFSYATCQGMLFLLLERFILFEYFSILNDRKVWIGHTFWQDAL